tara:strand:- start:77626 stop:78432 length:807 start_codon:yes stop_codon:yes gene_type:complete
MIEITNKINAPIKYFGGKGTMFNKIIKHFPKEYTTYVEPFAGSFAVGLKKPVCPIEVYNDLEKNVYNLYHVISDEKKFKKFKELADLYPYSEDFRKEFKLNLKDEEISDIDKAFYFFYVNRTSHNGIGGLSLNNTIRRKMSKSISDYLSAVDRLEELHQRISKVIILNRDGIEVIKKYDNPNTLIYCDPPYHHTTRTAARYKQDMTNDEQITFLNAVNKSKSKILISGYKNDIYDEHLKDWTEINFEVQTQTGTFAQKTKIETLWKNY